MAGQTLSQIRSLLSGAELAPQHRLGQNFLVDLNLMRKVVEAAELSAADTVLEVGAGTGSLTELLLERDVQVVAVELDRGLGRILRDRVGRHPRLTLIQADALESKHRVNPLALSLVRERPPRSGGHYKLVANLPYQIATPLIADMLQVDPRFERLTCTIQREVGQRLAAPPGVASYGPASVTVQTLATVTPHAILPPTAFWPRPKVQSILVTIRPRPAKEVDVDDVPGFVAFVQRAFQQRRKMLRRLAFELEPTAALQLFGIAGVSADARPADLSPSAWRSLYRAYCEVAGGRANGL